MPHNFCMDSNTNRLAKDVDGNYAYLADTGVNLRPPKNAGRKRSSTPPANTGSNRVKQYAAHQKAQSIGSSGLLRFALAAIVSARGAWLSELNVLIQQLARFFAQVASNAGLELFMDNLAHLDKVPRYSA